jgi:hypothetical protein
LRVVTPTGDASVLTPLQAGLTSDSSDYLGFENGANALFAAPGGVACDAAGNVYVADTGNSMVRVLYAGQPPPQPPPKPPHPPPKPPPPTDQLLPPHPPPPSPRPPPPPPWPPVPVPPPPSPSPRPPPPAVRYEPNVVQLGGVSPSPVGASTGGASLAVVVGSSVAGAFVVVLCFVLCLLRRRRRG